ncbi:MAG: 6-phosphogluconolactonase [Victivallaceae bacterium]|nr:6-phosphogluconolactonase [Victivallaceae bacterium]
MQQRMNYFLAAEAMYRAAAEQLCRTARQAVRRSGRFALVLSGGKTPLPLYRRMLRFPYSRDFPWAKTDFFWSDERWVPPFDPRSNYGNAMNAFLRQAGAAENRIHRIRTELPPVEAAADYAAELRKFQYLAGREKFFDLILLGMGEDGHTASLFPGSEALKETEKLAVAVLPPEKVQPAVVRVTLTYPALAAAETFFFLIRGDTKKALLISGKDLPAMAVKAEKTVWFIS